MRAKTATRAGKGVRGGRGMRRVAAAVALVAVAVPPAGAQQSAAGASGVMAGDTLVLTLEEAVELARGGNPAYRKAVNNVRLNSVEMRTTWADQILPRASLTLFDTNYRGNLRRIGTDNLGNPLERPDVDWVYFSGTTQYLSLDWEIQGASIFHALDRQKAANRARTLEEVAAAAELRTTVGRDFYEVREQRDLLALEADLLEARRLDLEMAERLFELAQNTRVDVLNAELGIERQELALQRQRTAYEQARLALRSDLGSTELGPFVPAEEPLPTFDPSGLDDTALVRAALSSNPSIRATEASFEEAGLAVDEANTAWWPTVNLGYDVWRQAQDPETSALFDFDFGSPLEQSFRVGLSVPFFNNTFGNLEAIEQAEVGLANVEADLRQARLETEEQVRSALIDLRNAWANLRVNLRAVEIAEEALRLARDEYRFGQRTFEQLQESIRSEAEARRELLISRYAFVDALLNLEEQVGGPVRPADAGAGPGGGGTP